LSDLCGATRKLAVGQRWSDDMSRRSVVFLTSLWLCALPAIAFAWDDFGHMVIAYVAYERLTSPTRARVKALLQLNPYHAPTWRLRGPAHSSAATRDRMMFMLAATWADAIKQDPAYHDDGSGHGDRPPPGPSARRNAGYSDRARHKYWHFVDRPFSRDG